MEWLAQNWIWVVFAVAFVVMHIFGHGSHRGHGWHRSDENPRRVSSAVLAGLPVYPRNRAQSKPVAHATVNRKMRCNGSPRRVATRKSAYP